MNMSDHYYSQKPNVASDPKIWSYELQGHSFRFKTDNGVFSKSEVDFGSRLLIETFVPTNIEGPILDVGCGYGPIGLSMAKQFPNHTIHMVDVNERALMLAQENAQLNHIQNVNIYKSNSFDKVKERGFSAILTNPPIRAGKKVVTDILDRSYEYLKPGGELWVVIQKKQGAPSAKKRIEECFQNVEVVKKDKGYYILKGKKI